LLTKISEKQIEEVRNMALVKWEDPFKSIKDALDIKSLFSWFEDIDKDFFKFPKKRGFVPLVDIYEKDNKVVMELELPGVKKEDIEVKIEGDRLIITGEVKEEKEVKKENYYRSERRYGKFERSFTIDRNISPEEINAEYKDGILKITLPKKEVEEEVKKIEIK
jgi:HSP20 family protein